MNDDERGLLDAWVRELSAALELVDLPLDIDDVLDLAGTAARTVLRPAAPLTTFIVGYAAGRAAESGTEPGQAMREAIAVAESLREAR
jgi:hypothetical protein